MTQVPPHKVIVKKIMKNCALCCHKHTTTVCEQCNEKYCVACIDPHTNNA